MAKQNIEVDILESNIPNDILEVLLKDHTVSAKDIQHNIFWATQDYEELGKGYGEQDEITCESVSSNRIIIPRVLKSKLQQSARSKDMAEVFTPSWICNAQNNLIDEAWFGRKNVFNKETTSDDGKHSWKATTDKIVFPENKTWRDYVRENRLEISCGEAPYLVSRYDATTGDAIPIEQRIGLLDRKLRIVGENTETTSDWLEAAQDAYKSTYGYEWQGDNLLLAREALLYSFSDYYRHKFGKEPLKASIKYIAYIISWNLWQMDGLKGVVPNSCHIQKVTSASLFDTEEIEKPCDGCVKGDIHKHNGIYCKIKDWQTGGTLKFVSLLKR